MKVFETNLKQMNDGHCISFRTVAYECISDGECADNFIARQSNKILIFKDKSYSKIINKPLCPEDNICFVGTIKESHNKTFDINKNVVVIDGKVYIRMSKKNYETDRNSKGSIKTTYDGALVWGLMEAAEDQSEIVMNHFREYLKTF